MLRETPCHQTSLCYTISLSSTNWMLKGQLYRCCIQQIHTELYTNTRLEDTYVLWGTQSMALYYFCMVYHMFCAISPATFRYSNGPMSHKASVIRLQLIWSTSPTGLLLHSLVITVLNNNVHSFYSMCYVFFH